MVLLFFVTNVLGDPAELLIGDDATERQIEALRKQHGLDRPLLERFAEFFVNMLKGDFGRSYRFHMEARDLALERLPNTAFLAAVAWGLGALGIPIGMIAARRPRGLMDRAVNVLSFAIVSVPDFWLALMIILVLAVQFDLLPTSGFRGLGPSGWQYVILPALALCPRVMGINAQVTRAVMIDEMGKQYVATARAKGLAERRVLYRHVMKNAAIAIVTVLGAEMVAFMNGVAIVETIFAWPGLGKLLVDAIFVRDLPIITAAVFIVALMVTLINLAVDLVYTWLDPRISYR